MTQLLADPIMALAALVVVLLFGALIWAGSRRPYVREVERLRDDLHNLLSSGEQTERIPVNGRLSASPTRFTNTCSTPSTSAV